jgi:signal transduction histidine kinase/ActR/RegA family two-component response regulator
VSLDERSSSPNALERVLVLVKGRREAQLTIDLLARDNVPAYPCEDMNALCVAIEEGVGVLLLAEELLTASSLRQLRNVLDRQPPWSDLPIVVFSAPGDTRGALAKSAALLGNVTFLDRPVRVRSMLASVHAAMASRRRQYDARRAIESRDAFLAMLGHELRNPLGAISLAASLLQKKAPETKHIREHTILVRQTEHLSRLVDDLLDVARFTHGKIRLKREPHDLVEVVRSAFDALEERAKERGLGYHLRLPDVSPWVAGDPQRLEQALSNLLTNAIKYTPRGGSVTVTVRCEASTAVIDVTDDGIGLGPETRRSVFAPFAQVDSSLNRADGGLGLGLAIVHAIIQLHGGTVEARSEGLGHGSSFIVRLARLDTRATHEPLPTRKASFTGQRKRVLLVDDNEDLRDLLAEIVRDHEVTCAEDGPDGLAQVLSWRPDVAFVDIGLPGFDGFELARRARASGFEGRLIALTGYGQASDRERALGAGFDDHLIKPVGDAEIQRALLETETNTPASAL